METAKKKIIEITVRDKVATHVGDDFYVCGNTDYEVHFDFDEEWDALDVKTARFIADGNVLYPDRVFSGSVCSFPDNPPISNTTSVRVGVFAGNLHTTTPARIPAAKSVLCGTPTPAAPEEDAYHEAMEEMAKVATEARTKAAESTQSAEASAKSAETSAQSAKESAQSAVEAAASAQDSRRAAEVAWQYSANADAQAKAAGESASDAAASALAAEKAKQTAIDNADDAEAAASDAQTWAGRAEAFAGNAATSASNAETAAVTSTKSAVSAADSKTQAAEIVREMTGGVGGLYIVCVNEDLMSNRTQAEIIAAIEAGKTCIMVDPFGEVHTCYGMDEKRPAFVAYRPGKVGIWESRKFVETDGTVTAKMFTPATTPNPAPLLIKGEVETRYDGSEMVVVTIPSGGDGGGVPDPGTAHQQLVSDADGRAAWQPLTHYVETVNVVVLANISLTTSDGTAYLITPPAAEPTAGGKYNVTWNGASYECEGVAYDMDGVPCVYMGNAAGMGGEDTGEPFAMIFLPADTAAVMGAYAMIVPMDGATEIELSISGQSEIVHKLDDKFLNGRNNNIENGTGANSLRQRSAAAEGDGYTLGVSAMATGRGTKASGLAAHAEGRDTTASEDSSHAEGSGTTASGMYSHAEGERTTASGGASHAEGRLTTASGSQAHAEGRDTTASGAASHAEGSSTTASGDYSHAEGNGTTASGLHSHAEGSSTTASGSHSHAEGWHTIAASPYQHVQGRFNVEDTTGKYLHIVGNGGHDENRSNAHTLDTSGNAWYAGTVEGTALIISSPNGTRFQITVDDTGALTVAAL